MPIIKKTKELFKKRELTIALVVIFLLLILSVINAMKKTIIVSAICVGLLLIFLFPLSPKTRFISLCTLSFLSPLFRIFGNFSFYTILLAEFNLLSFLELLLKKKLRILDFTKILIPVIIFLCACLLSFIGSSISLSNFTSLAQFFLFTSITVWYFIFKKLGIVQSGDLAWLLLSFALSIIIMLPVYFSFSYGKALFAYFGYPSNALVFNKNFFGTHLTEIRFTGCLVDPNYYGCTSLFSALICFGKIVLQDKKRLLWIFSTVFFIICGGLSLSTSYFIDLFLFFFIFFAFKMFHFSKQIDYRRLFAILFIVLIVSAILIYQFVSKAFNFPKDFTVRLFFNSFSSYRTEAFRLGVLQIFSSPKIFLFGSGWDNFLLFYDSDFSAHNSIIESLNTVGLFGFASFLYMHITFYSVSALRFSTMDTKMLSFMILGIILLSLFSIPAFGSAPFSLYYLLLIEFVPNNSALPSLQRKAQLNYAK
jgi:hypothetical protein